MLKRWAAWPSGIRWLVRIPAVVLAAAIVWALFVPLADWLARHDVGSAAGALHETALDNARGRLLTLGAGLVAGGALVFTALNFNLLRRNSEQTDQWQRRTYELTEQGQITDRYTKAVEQLGSDKLDVRIGGIYALERVDASPAAVDRGHVRGRGGDGGGEVGAVDHGLHAGPLSDRHRVTASAAPAPRPGPSD